MPSTYTHLLYHLIFATKHREPLITENFRTDLHEYLGGTVRGLGAVPQGVGGVADHVHHLVWLSATHCLADFMRELKRCSSLWIAERNGNRDFKWQEGYAAFSVSASTRESVREYIARQEEHHRKKTSRSIAIRWCSPALRARPPAMGWIPPESSWSSSLHQRLQSTADFLNIRARVKGRDAEVAFAGGTEAGAGGDDDLRLLQHLVEHVP